MMETNPLRDFNGNSKCNPSLCTMLPWALRYVDIDRDRRPKDRFDWRHHLDSIGVMVHWYDLTDEARDAVYHACMSYVWISIMRRPARGSIFDGAVSIFEDDVIPDTKENPLWTPGYGDDQRDNLRQWWAGDDES